MKRVYIVIDERTNLIVKVYNNRKKADDYVDKQEETLYFAIKTRAVE